MNRGRWIGRLKSEKGDMLILSLLISALFLTFSAGYLGLLVVEGDSTERIFQLNQALHAAESGAEEAIWEIKYNNSTFSGWDTSGNPYTKDGTLTDATNNVIASYTISVTDPTGTSPSIESIGSALYKAEYISEKRTIVVDLSMPSSGAYNYAALAQTSITMYSNACTDSFDSSLGGYDFSTNKGSNGDVVTNSTSGSSITLRSNAEVDGNVYAGEGGDPDSVISARARDITGSTDALESAVTIDSIIGPTGLTDNGDVEYDGNGSYTISSSGQYDDFTIGGNVSVTLSGNIQLYITDTFEMNSNSELIIAEGSQVEIYVDGGINFRSNTDINNSTGDPQNLKIYGTDSLVDDGSEPGIRFRSNTDIYAIVQAKNSTVELSSNAEVFGTVMADSVELHSNSCIHYDENLGTGSGAGSQAEVTFWHEK